MCSWWRISGRPSNLQHEIVHDAPDVRGASKILELPASYAFFFGGAPGVSFFPGVSPGRSGGIIFRRVIFHEGRLIEAVPKLARPHDSRRKGRRRLAERPVRGDENGPPVFLFQKTQDERVGDFVSGEQYLHTARASPPSIMVGFAVEYDGNLGISAENFCGSSGASPTRPSRPASKS